MKKYSTKSTLCVFAASILPVLAGEPDSVASAEETAKLIDFSLNARARYEFREVEGLDPSHAGTLRIRPGITIFPKNDLSLFVESEHTLALIDDYQVGTPQSANFTPYKANNTPIADPESNEINQAYLLLNGGLGTLKAGRQRLILDNAAFVGNVGWRQNEQTIDGLNFVGNFDKLKLNYTMASQVNRIFGSDASGPVQALEGNIHLLNYHYGLSNGKVGGYMYYMDFSEQAPGFPINASNVTYGGFVDWKNDFASYHVELGYQNEVGSKPGYSAFYGAMHMNKKVGAITWDAGIEYLEDGFVTPLATVHAFNGFADTFISNRLGLVNTWDGLTDLYVGASTKLNCGMILKAKLHHFRDDSLSNSYGWEIDSVAVKPINASTKILAKLAYFLGEDGSPFPNDVSQASIQMDYQF